MNQNNTGFKRWLRWLQPTHRLSSVLEITPEWMAQRGIKGLLLDIDNTLVPHGFEGDLPEVMAWSQRMRAAKIPMRIISNARPSRIRRWASKLEIQSVDFAGTGTGMKPLRGAFRTALTQLQLEACESLMVGDQIFTDVLGGNAVGCQTLFLQALNDDGLPHTKLARKLENWVLGLLE